MATAMERKRFMVWCVVWVSLQARGAAETPLVCGSKIDHHGIHFGGIDGGVVPCHTVASASGEATDHALQHAALELLPRGIPRVTVLNTRLSGVVKKFIVLNPESSVPSFEVGVTVHGCLWLMWLVYRVARSVAVGDVPHSPLSTLRGRGEDLGASGNVCLRGGRPCHHGVVLTGVVSEDGGEVGLFVHAVIIGTGSGGLGVPVDTPSGVTCRSGSLPLPLDTLQR